MDSGANWSAINDGLTRLGILAVAIDPVTPSNLYAGTLGTGVFHRSQGLIFKSGFED